jgi:hypothetical protein
LGVSGIKDPTCESNHHLKKNQLDKLLREMFHNTNDWPTPDQVCTIHI